MNLLWIFLTSFFVAFSGALSPGPLFAITIVDTGKYGSKTGPLLIIGHAFIEFILIVFMILGLSEILKNKTFNKFIIFFGCIVLFIMGFLIILDSSKKEIKNNRNKMFSNISLPIKGIMASISNPYWFLWWLTIGLTYFTISLKFGAKGVFVFFVGHILADFIWYSIVSIGIWKNKKFIEGKFYKWLCNFCGIFLLGFSIFLFFRFYKL